MRPSARHRGAIGHSRGGLTSKNHLVCDGRGRTLAFVLAPGQAADTSMLIATLDKIRVPAGRGRPRTRPDRVIADKSYPSKANRAWLRERGTAATIPERDDQIAHRRKASSLATTMQGSASLPCSNGCSTRRSPG
ncbi:transposase [Actinomadura sp. KC345]|uniref:transposase n=1 Tax=Actinomadura sp. KC345 TaxID=2530371 RepID=UPI00140494A2|nr:transposase [Actinomadura sp. KC345]